MCFINNCDISYHLYYFNKTLSLNVSDEGIDHSFHNADLMI